MTRKAFDNMLLHESRCNYHNYSLVSKQVLRLEVKSRLEEVKQVCSKCLKYQLEKLNLIMTNLTESLAG